jgi:hypothetical protein
MLFTDLLLIPLTINGGELQDGLDPSLEYLLYDPRRQYIIHTLIMHLRNMLPPAMQPPNLNFAVFSRHILFTAKDLQLKLGESGGVVLPSTLTQQVAHVVGLAD